MEAKSPSQTQALADTAKCSESHTEHSKAGYHEVSSLASFQKGQEEEDKGQVDLLLCQTPGEPWKIVLGQARLLGLAL